MALADQFFDIAERERVPKVPAHGAKNQFGLRLLPLEDRRSGCLLHDLFRLPAVGGQSCNTIRSFARQLPERNSQGGPQPRPLAHPKWQSVPRSCFPRSVVYYLLRTPTAPEAKPITGDDAPATAPAISFGPLIVDLPCLVLGGHRAEHCPTVECRRYGFPRTRGDVPS